MSGEGGGKCVLKEFFFFFERTIHPGPAGIRDARRADDHRGVPERDRVRSDDGVGDLPPGPHKGVAEALDACCCFFCEIFYFVVFVLLREQKEEKMRRWER